MELSEIEAFITIARSGGFTRAAELLHISQPAISRRIELLERELGTSLFQRLPGGTRLSDAGQAFLPYAQQVLAALEDGKAVIHGLTGKDQGKITLALVGTLASTRLTAHLRTFREAYPQIGLKLRTARSDEVSSLVQQGDAHLGLRYFHDPAPDVTSHLVMDEPLLVVCAPQSHYIEGEPNQPAALLGIPWVTFPRHTGSSGEAFARLLERHLLRVGLDGAERVIIDSLTAQKRLIEADFGIGLLPASSVEEELQLGTLRVLPIAELQASTPVMVIHRSRAYLSRAVQLLLAVLTGRPA